MVPPAEIVQESTLFLTLRDVTEVVSNNKKLSQTLDDTVRLIQKRFQSDVCSVYTCEPNATELVLAATVGLRQECVNNLRMPFSQGLVGLVAEQKAPVNEPNAPKNKRFLFFPESGEAVYVSFLGVPMIHGGEVQGVLVIQHRRSIRYTPNEVRLMEAVAAQLAVLVYASRLTTHLSSLVTQSSQTQAPGAQLAEIHGISASPGMGLGRALRFEEFDFSDPKLVQRVPESVESERKRFAESLLRSREEINQSALHLADLLGEQFGALMQAQQMMLEDPTLNREVHRRLEQGQSVESAVVAVFQQYLQAFQKLDKSYFYERIYDIKDVFRRLLTHAEPKSQLPGAEPVVLVAGEVSLLELFSSDLRRVRAIVVEQGGAHCHVAILARSLKIPMLTGCPGLLKTVDAGDLLFVDADAGTLFINPAGEKRTVLERLIQQTPTDESGDEDFKDVPLPMRVDATVNLLPEVARTVANGGSAVGLYRSEMLELARRAFPSEEEQLATYQKMINLLDGRPLTIRTLDLRPDKMFSLAHDSKKAKQVWDWRMVADLPNVQALILSQLRALLQAAAMGPVRILFPMVVMQRQFECALQLVEDAKESLRREGAIFESNTPIGVMIESPSAVMLARSWMPYIDFVCIGSNDLLHSLLNISRDDDRFARFRSPLEPTYLRAVRHVVRAAHAQKKSVTVCGNIASHPKTMLALLALGVDGVSIPPDDMPAARRYLRDQALTVGRSVVGRRILQATAPDQIEAILDTCFVSRSEPAPSLAECAV